MYPPQREPQKAGDSHTFTHVFYVVVSRHVFEDFEKRLGKLEHGDAANNRPLMERAFLRTLGAAEIFDAGPPPDAPRTQEQHDREDEEWRRKQRVLEQLNSAIVERIQPGVIMKKARDSTNASQSPEHLRNRKQ